MFPPCQASYRLLARWPITFASCPQQSPAWTNCDSKLWPRCKSILRRAVLYLGTIVTTENMPSSHRSICSAQKKKCERCLYWKIDGDHLVSCSLGEEPRYQGVSGQGPHCIHALTNPLWCHSLFRQESLLSSWQTAWKWSEITLVTDATIPEKKGRIPMLNLNSNILRRWIQN